MNYNIMNYNVGDFIITHVSLHPALIVDKNGEIIFGYSHPFNENSIGAMHWSRFYYKLPRYYN